MSHQPESLANLIYKFLSGEITAEEEMELREWLQQSPGNAAYFNSLLAQLHSGELSEKYLSPDNDRIWQKITEQIPGTAQQAPVVALGKRRLKIFAVAASITALTISGIWFAFFNTNTDHSKLAVSSVSGDVLPGGYRAVLTLADGSQVPLDTACNGQLLMQKSVRIMQTEKGKLEYQYTKADRTMETSMYNTITVPAGGRFKVALPDGSQVWLNALSSLRYPVAFNVKERNVTLQGEGYFEVAPRYAENLQSRVPFNVTVQSENGKPVSKIEVKGTHFNINAYDSVLKTTLTEGKVKVISQSGASALLSPGQQAVQKGDAAPYINNMTDPEQATAWVSGWFNFNNATIREIMDEVARWYSLRVVYLGENNKHFSLNLPRDLPISKLLQVLEMTGSIQFNINTINQTITVQQ